MPFPFEQLTVYQYALAWVEAVETLCRTLKGKVSYPFLDQLSRAALSIPLNIAEGNGRWHMADKRQFFWIARGSIFECVPLIQLFHRKKLISDNSYQTYYAQLDTMAKMTTRLIQSLKQMSEK